MSRGSLVRTVVLPEKEQNKQNKQNKQKKERRVPRRVVPPVPVVPKWNGRPILCECAKCGLPGVWSPLSAEVQHPKTRSICSVGAHA
jgi:hypothetical protein